MSKSVCIFIRTYQPDLPWLRWCLKALDLNWVESEVATELVISCDAVCKPEIEAMETKFPRLIATEEQWADGYIFQQYVKLRADLYTQADAILFLDSDAILTRPISVKDFGRNSRIVIPFDYYRTLGNTVPWQKIVTEVMGRQPDKEYMRRLPIMHWRETVQQARFHIEQTHKRPIHEILMARPHRSMSEFNCIGFYAEWALPNKYWFVESQYHDAPAMVRQFHSYSENPDDARVAYESQLPVCSPSA